MKFVFPLHWPENKTRWPEPTSSDFRVSFNQAVNALARELDLMGAENARLATNARLTRANVPSVSEQLSPALGDCGAELRFDCDDTTYSIVCDEWNRLRDNIHAIGLTVAALNGIERLSGYQLLYQTMSAFRVMSSRAGSREWGGILRVPSEASVLDIKKAYRDAARVHHPDVGGSVEEMQKINLAYESAMLDCQRD